MRFKKTMTTSSSNVDATTNLEKILATGRYRGGPPEEMFFSKFQRACHICPILILNKPVCESKYILMTLTSNFQCVLKTAIYFSWSYSSTRTDYSWALSTQAQMTESSPKMKPDVKRFVTKRLAWEGLKLRALKDVLDLAHKRLLKPHVRKFPDRKSCWQEILFTRRPFSGYKHTCTGKIVIWKCPCRYEGAGTLIIHLQFQAYFSDLLCLKILWATLVNCLPISYFFNLLFEIKNFNNSFIFNWNVRNEKWPGPFILDSLH